MEDLKKIIIDHNYGLLEEDVDLSKHTSLHIGGIGRYMFYPVNITSLTKVFKYLINHQIDYYIIGNGTNLLINNRYFNTFFINLKKLNKYQIISENRYFLEAGINAPVIAKHLASIGYTNVEFMSIIPGTIGGLIYMNAGAYHMEIADIIESVLYLNEEGILELYLPKRINFGYRKTIFQQQKGIILGCIVKLSKAKELKAPLSRIKNYILSKKKNQPINQYNAGSTFRNFDAISAWQVIDQIGMRGQIVGGAKVSEKHANFLINFNQASYQDMINLINHIKANAKEQLNIDLECEWKMLN